LNHYETTQQSHTFASRYKPPHRPKLAKECARPTQDRISKYFFQRFKKNKTPYTQALTMQTADKYKKDNWTTEKKHMPITAVWRNGGFSASYDSFVVGSSVVLRLNFCAKNPPLRQAANR